MNKQTKTTKFLRNPVISMPSIQQLSKIAKTYAHLSSDETTRMFVIHFSSIGQYNKPLTMKTTTTIGKIQKLIRNMGEEKVEAI